MQSVSIVFVCMSIGIESILGQHFYNAFQRCRENAKRENLVLPLCIDYPDWRRHEDSECQPNLYIIDKNITCTRASAVYLKGYRESTEEGPSYPLTLRVTDSDIPVLPTSTFRYLKNVTVLILENIKLNKIMPGAFNFLERLKEVYLGKNKLTAVSDGIFNSLTALEKIDLSRNRIEVITNDAFAGIALNDLNLSNNNISVLEEVLIKSLSHLSVLDMSLNNLKNISSFSDLSIKYLNLSHNSIESVNFGVFPKTPVTFVDISFNKISKFTNFNSSNAQKIILSHNRLKDFPKYDHKYNSINFLDISYNNVEIIDSLSITLLEFYASFNFIFSLSVYVFSGLHSLTHLYLDNNNLSMIPNSCFKDLTSLTHLNLSGNKLTEFKFGTFDNLKKLQVLDISNNKFKELPQYTFHSLSQVTDLFFQNNEISIINTDDLVDHMKMLRKINLDNNTWSCERLVNIVHKLKSKKILFSDGNSWEESNIHGIECYETFRNRDAVNTSNSEINLVDSKLTSFFNEDFTKTVLYKYFNQEFKNTEFFKYLESLRKSTNYSHMQITNDNAVKKLNINSSDMYNYFNNDFKNSNFFKYLENFTYQTPNISQSEKISVNKLDEISDLLKNFTKEIENLLTANYSIKLDFQKSKMYNYFNEDFRTSNFFRYLESLNKMPVKEIHSENINESTADQLVNSIKINEYPIFMLYVNATVLMLILIVILIIAYRFSFCRNNKYVLAEKEQVELL